MQLEEAIKRASSFINVLGNEPSEIESIKDAKAISTVLNEIYQLEKENKKLKFDLDLKKGSVLARHNIAFCEENERLKQQIDKALEYINSELEYMSEHEWFYKKLCDLKQILKGDENDRT